MLTPALKLAFGLFAVLLSLAAYVPYLINTLYGRTKPHAFSWLVWATLTGIGFFGQLSERGGAGAWVTGVTAILCFIIFILALFKGEKDITRSDWCCLLFSGVAILLWIMTTTPLWSIFLITVIDAVAFIPTYRKSFLRPEEETAVTFVVSAVKFLFALLAMENYSVVTTLYPASLVLTNTLFVTMLVIRRRTLNVCGTARRE